MSEVDSKQLPEGWRLCKLGDVMRLKNGYAFKSKDYAESGIPLVRISDIKEGEVIIDDAVYIPDDKSNDDFLVEPGDLLIAMSGATTGKTGVYKGSQPVLQNQRVGNFKILDESVVDKRYRDYYVSSLRRDIEKAAYGGAQPNISSKGIEAFEFPLAPPEQQKRIVAKIEELFSHIDAGIEALKKAKQLLKQYRQSVLKAAVTGELTKEWREANKDRLEPPSQLLERILKERREKWEEQQLEQFKTKGKMPKDDKWKEKYKQPIKPKAQGAGYPDAWIWVTWDQVGLNQNGRAFPSKEYCDSGFKLLRPGNLHVSGRVVWTEKNTKNMPITWADDFPNYIVEGNELVMNLTAQSLADEFLGRICLTNENEKCLLNQRIARLMPILVDEKFILYLFKSKSFRAFVDGLNTGSLIQHMYTTQLVEFEFSLPPVDEQKEIVKIIEQKLSAIEHIELTLDEQFGKSEVNKQSILASAFSGQI